VRPRQAKSLHAQAVGLLARREYARVELEQKLLGKGWDRSEVRATLDELAAEGYLSDARYARALVAQKSGRYSRHGIAAELKTKGVAAQEIEAALADANLDDEAALAALWQRRFGRAPADEREKARQVRFLQSRGFSLSAILKLLRGAKASGS
jgi:regulatory protein